MESNGKCALTPTSPSKAARLDDPDLRLKFEENLRIWEDKGRPVIEAAQASERLTERDLAIRINTFS